MLLTSRACTSSAAACSRAFIGRLAPAPRQVLRLRRSVTVYAEDGPSPSQSTSTKPEDDPLWVKREKQREMEAKQGSKGVPWPLYLVASVLVAIASVGSVFEYIDKNPIFGVVQPDSPLWAPILGMFAVTGIPTAGFLFFKGVKAANEAAEAQDRLDGYIE